MNNKPDQRKKNQSPSGFQLIEAIASGVETRLKRTLTEFVIIDTINVARKLKISEKEIQSWRTIRRIPNKDGKTDLVEP